MGRPVGSQNFESRPDKDCTQRRRIRSIRRIAASSVSPPPVPSCPTGFPALVL